MDPGVDSLTRSPSSANMPFFGILLCSVTLMQRCTLAVNSVSLSADIQCPNGCVCQLYHRINCANISLGDLPTQLPEVTTELQFTAGHLPIIPADSFLNLSHLMALHLSGNNIRQVKPGAFNGLSQLQYLHLNNNSIEALEIGVFREVTTVTYLHLENNLIANLMPGSQSSFTHQAFCLARL
ncbi:chondroadherin-like [Scyliorhinus canicula]|uniref:chondroadherin-like n=1 Tax=Scyliorhinus canicula TaxID=7830 RepID=UPI0018F40068|nr:chondroadherin-like [Scyliorhinus canicula]